MGTSGLSLGQKGERQAAKFLIRKGYDLIETNYRTPFAEIDIIARHEGFLCFIEVKTRKSLRKGLPREAVTRAKQQKILAGANQYLREQAKKNTEGKAQGQKRIQGQIQERIRFDVLEVFMDADSGLKDKWEFVLIPGAFQADEG